MNAYVCTFTPVRAGKSMSGSSFSCFPHYGLRQGLSPNLEPMGWLKWLSTEPQGPAYLCLANAGVTYVHSYSQLECENSRSKLKSSWIKLFPHWAPGCELLYFMKYASSCGWNKRSVIWVFNLETYSLKPQDFVSGLEINCRSHKIRQALDHGVTALAHPFLLSICCTVSQA